MYQSKIGRRTEGLKGTAVDLIFGFLEHYQRLTKVYQRLTKELLRTYRILSTTYGIYQLRRCLRLFWALFGGLALIKSIEFDLHIYSTCKVRLN